MKSKKRELLMLLVIFIVLSLVLTGCTKQKQESSSDNQGKVQFEVLPPPVFEGQEKLTLDLEENKLGDGK